MMKYLSRKSFDFLKRSFEPFVEWIAVKIRSSGIILAGW